MRQPESALNSEAQAAPSIAGTAPTPASAGFSPRVLIAGLLFGILGLVIVLVAVQVFVVNPIPELTEAKLDQAERLWAKAGPASYDMDVELRGAQPGRVHIEVRNREVTKMTRDGRPPPQRTWDVWSVPGQFETLERELELSEDPEHEMQVATGTQLRLRCDFDPKFGFPRQYHRHTSGGGPEVYWRVTNFTPKRQ